MGNDPLLLQGHLSDLRWLLLRPNADRLALRSCEAAPCGGIDGRVRVQLLKRPDLLCYFSAFVLVFVCSTMGMMNLPLMILSTLGGTQQQVGIAYSVAPVFELPFMVVFGLLASRGKPAPLMYPPGRDHRGRVLRDPLTGDGALAGLSGSDPERRNGRGGLRHSHHVFPGLHSEPARHRHQSLQQRQPDWFDRGLPLLRIAHELARQIKRLQ